MFSNGPMAWQKPRFLWNRESCELSTGWETGKVEPLNMSVQYTNRNHLEVQPTLLQDVELRMTAMAL